MKRPVSNPKVVVFKRRGCSKEITYKVKPKQHIAPNYTPERLPKEKIDPLQAASFYINGFNRDKMTLNGRPVHIDVVMKLCNAVLAAQGMPQILHNPAWQV